MQDHVLGWLHGQKRGQSTQTCHHILVADSEINEAGDLVYAALMELFGLAGAMVKRSNKAQGAEQIVAKLGSDHDLAFPLAEA